MANPFRLLSSDWLRMDLRELGKLYSFFKAYPHLARKGVAQFLNDIGFAWRPVAVSTLAKRLIMRNPKFILRQMRVQKTSARPIEQQAVVVGSVYKRGSRGDVTFDGFRSLYGSAPETRSRTLSLLTRGGSKAARARRMGKLHPSDDVPTPDQWDDMTHPTRPRMLQFMIRDIAKNFPTQKFIVPRGYGFEPGLYRVMPGSRRGYRKTRRGKRTVGRWALSATARPLPKLQILQHFGRRPRGQRWKWLDESVKWIVRGARVGEFWHWAIERVTREAMDKARR